MSILAFILSRGKVMIEDSLIFRLHYKLTAPLLLGLWLVCITTSFVNNPITCAGDRSADATAKLAREYCLAHSTFTVRKNYEYDGSGVAHPGIRQFGDEHESRKIYAYYYQWVPFVLFLQALMFYAPYWLWKYWEGGKVEAVTRELTSITINKEKHDEKIHLIARYLQTSLHQHKHYALKFLFCDVLNYLITLANIYLTDRFLGGGRFVFYGTEVFSSLMTQDTDYEPMENLFPLFTKCEIKKFGPSGAVESDHFLCLLSLNGLYARVYLLLWVWFSILKICGVVEIIWRCLVFFSSAVQRWVFRRFFVEKSLENHVDSLYVHLQLGDFFLLSLLRQNIGNVYPSSFGQLVKVLSEGIGITGKKREDIVE